MDKTKLIIYQINPRMFTLGGTIADAGKLLGHVRDAGANVAYLCPVFKEDEEKNESTWSKRQRKTGLGNPKNPYRIADYYEIDREYGTKAQLKNFVAKAHRLGLLVMLDLVYYHCGPNAKLIKTIPDGVVKDENGAVKAGRWGFPELNFESPALRRYIKDNMLYYVRDFGVDGYRCDVGDRVPLEFWDEAVKELKEIKPDIVMLNEGRLPEYTESGVFDFNYGWPQLVKADPEDVAGFLDENFGDDVMKVSGQRIFFVENHDTVTDEGRAETKFGSYAADLLYVWLFTAPGTPFIYCGEEIADDNPHCLFANRSFNRGYGINWARAFSAQGKRRASLIKKLSALRLSENALNAGNFKRLSVGKGITAFERKKGKEKIAVFINFNGEKISIPDGGKVLLKRRLAETGKERILSKNGFAIIKY
ncbi:MAG: hypothetical protein IJV00_01375 [Clostridia bacterium]|nr:hypothetical protein [Clostridia bacterium]